MRAHVLALAFVAAFPFAPSPTVAEGALAIALPSDVAKGGFAYGRSANWRSEDEARADALKFCRESATEPKLRSLCAVIDTFRDQCAAIAMDPKAGTPGVGWAIAATRQAAERQALTQCRDTAGSSRRDFCEVDKGVGSVTGTLCDGSAR
jgi:hypothetical protein